VRAAVANCQLARMQDTDRMPNAAMHSGGTNQSRTTHKSIRCTGKKLGSDRKNRFILEKFDVSTKLLIFPLYLFRKYL